MSRPRERTRRFGHDAFAWLVAILPLSGCGGAPPALRHYTLAVQGEAKPAVEDGPTLVVTPLVADSAYDTDRIVYRLNPYRLDYYNYHRWSAHPGLLVADSLRRAYLRTGLFRQVLGQLGSNAVWVLAGRIAALDEVDDTAERWQAHIALELSLSDSRSGAVVWSAVYDRREPMPERNPEGLARALSAALARIVAESAPTIAELARQAPGGEQSSNGRELPAAPLACQSSTTGMLAEPSESPLSASTRPTSSRTLCSEAGTCSK